MIEINNSLLNYILNEANIPSIDDALEDYEKMANSTIIEKHKSFSNIWKGTGSDTRWKTYLPDNNKRGRKLIASTTKEDIENKILAYYKAHTSKKLAFNTLYMEWLNLKRLEVSNATIARYHSAYKRFYESHPINNTSIREINYLFLKEFLLSNIKEYNMDYKQYCNFSCILRGVLQYAIDKELIDTNPFDKFHIGKNTLRSPDNKSSKTEVFTIEERKQLEDTIWKDFRDNRTSAIPLALLLDFYTGLRVGELVTLKWKDIDYDNNVIHVHCTETSYNEILPDGTIGDMIYEVKESPKSEAGFRDVELIPKAIEVLKTIYQFNISNGWNNPYIFLADNKRIIRRRLDSQIRKYCKRLGIQARSMHKIRKYYISILKLSEVEDDEIRRLAGHKDITTTYNSYCFSILSKEETRNRIISAL